MAIDISEMKILFTPNLVNMIQKSTQKEEKINKN